MGYVERGHSTVTLILLLKCVCMFIYIIKKKSEENIWMVGL